MRANRRVLPCAALALSLAATGVVKAEQAAIGTLPTGSLGYAIAAAVANVVSDHSGIDLRAVGTGGSDVYLPQVHEGEIEFGTSNTVEAVYATSGTGNFEGRAIENLRVAAVLVPFTVGFVVPEDSDAQRVSDLKGEPFPTDYSAQRLVAALMEGALAAEDMTLDDFERVPVPNFVRGVELMTQGRVAGAFAAPGSGIMQQADADIGVRFLSLTQSEDGETAMQVLAPNSYFAMVEPGGGRAGINEPTVLQGYEYTLMVGANVDDEVVYETVKALHQNPGDLAAAHGVFNRWDPERIALDIGVSYHPGAEQYYEEAGLWPPKDQ